MKICHASINFVRDKNRFDLNRLKNSNKQHKLNTFIFYSNEIDDKLEFSF